MASDAVQSRDPVRRRHSRKIAQKARREFEAEVIKQHVVTKLWVNGRVNEDRDWTEEVRAQCERCYDDKEEPPEVEAERIQRQRRSGDGRVALDGYDLGGQGSADTKQDVPEQGQRACRLTVDCNAPVLIDENS